MQLTEDMFKTGQPVSQGEVNIWMKKYAPPEVLGRMVNLNLSEIKLERGQMIIGHSESGHHHVLEPVDKSAHNAARAVIDTANDTFIELKLNEPCELIHMRGSDTHGKLIFPPGEYIRGLREEQTVDGWRRVAD